MKSRKMLIVLGLTIVAPTLVHAAPKLKVGEESFDFGYTPEGLPVKHKFWVYNVGTDTLDIHKVRPSCGCTTVPLPKKRLHPGDSVALELQFDTKRFKGKIAKSAAIETNDLEHKDAKLHFIADVGLWEGIVIANPPQVYLDTLGKTEQVVSLKNTSVAPYKITITSPLPETMKFEISTMTLEGKGDARILIRSTDKTPLGEYHASLTLRFEGPEPHSLTIPVFGVRYIQ